MIYNATARGLLHGVAVPPSEECYLLEFGEAKIGFIPPQANAFLAFATNLWWPGGPCVQFPDGGAPTPQYPAAEIRQGNMQNDPATLPTPEDFRTNAASNTVFYKIFASSETSFITPAEIRLGNLIGVQSGATTTIVDAPRNAVDTIGEPVPEGCYGYGLGTIPLIMTISGPQTFVRSQTIAYELYTVDTGNAKAGDVFQLWYAETLFHEEVPNTFDNNDQVDWEASGYFLPGEECYFEGCPPPYYPTPYTFTPSSGGSGPSTFGGGPVDCAATHVNDQNLWNYFTSAANVDLSANTVPFIWEEALAVVNGISYAIQVCPVGSPDQSAKQGPAGWFWNAKNFAGQPPSTYTGDGGAVWAGHHQDQSGYTPPWGFGTLSGYLWFPGAPAA